MKDRLIKIVGAIVGLGVCYLILFFLTTEPNPWKWHVIVKILSIIMLFGAIRVAIEE